MRHPRFGKVHVYGETHRPAHLVILMSGDDGWTPALAERARALATLDTLVAGVGSRPFLEYLSEKKGECSIVSKSFRKLAKFIQHRYGYESYVFPILAGEGAGSAIVYAALTQAPPNIFAGGISFGFCPHIDLAKPFCETNGFKSTHTQSEDSDKVGYDFIAPESMADEWNILQGDGTASSCTPSVTKAYVRTIRNTKVIATDQSSKPWLDAFHTSQNRMLKQQDEDIRAGVPDALSDLPVVVMDVSRKMPDKPLVIFLSGDGGWARIDNGMAKVFNEKGIAVIGFDSLRYFWKSKTPEQTVKDVTRVIDYYDRKWKPSSIILVGYSRGADVLPFVLSRMPVEQEAHIRSMAMLAPGNGTKFKFSLLDWLPLKNFAVGISVSAEVRNITNPSKVVCFYGKDDTVTDSICPRLDPKRYHVIERDGNHHFNEKYQELVEQILSF